VGAHGSKGIGGDHAIEAANACDRTQLPPFAVPGVAGVARRSGYT
jgi:hypothetical protein